MRDASGTPATPMMPHMLRSVSHASRNGAVIYVAQPGDRLVERSVSQRKAEGPIHGTHRAGAEERDTELAGQCLYRRRALLCARNHGAAVGFAEQQLVGREACGVGRQIDVETKTRLLV